MAKVVVRQAGVQVAFGDIVNDRPASLSVEWTGQDSGGNTVVVNPDAVTWGIMDPTLGNIDPDGVDPTHKALYSPNAGTTGPQEFMATSHQTGLDDFAAEPADVNQVNPPPPPPVQITGGAVQVSQVAGATVRVTARRR